MITWMVRKGNLQLGEADGEFFIFFDGRGRISKRGSKRGKKPIFVSKRQNEIRDQICRLQRPESKLGLPSERGSELTWSVTGEKGWDR